MVNDWELAFIVEKIVESQNSHRFYHKSKFMLLKRFMHAPFKLNFLFKSSFNRCRQKN